MGTRAKSSPWTSRRKQCPHPCSHSGSPISSLPSWWCNKSTLWAHGALLHFMRCVVDWCSCMSSLVCQRSRVCAWRTWKPSSEPEQQASRSDLLRPESSCPRSILHQNVWIGLHKVRLGCFFLTLGERVASSGKQHDQPMSADFPFVLYFGCNFQVLKE